MNFRPVIHSLVALAATIFVFGGAATASAAAPANDNFSAAQVIGPALPISVPATTVDATSQAPTEPNIGGNAPISSIWFRWTAPAAGPVVVNLCDSGFTGSDYPTERFAVWTGAALNALTEIETTVGECLLRFNAVNATIYSIQVDYGDDQGSFNFKMRQMTPPTNDNFASPAVIGPALPVSVPSTNLDSNHQAGEPPFLGGASSSRSVWYRWTAPATGQVRIDVCDFERISGAANKALAVYTGATIGTLVTVVSTNYCEISFNANSGTVYQIAFSGYISGEGTFTFRMKNAPRPANDDFANAQTVGPQLPVTAQGSNEFSTVQVGEPSHGGIGGSPAYSSWFNWTPAQNVRVKIRSCSKTFNARLGVYTGAAVNALTEVGEDPPYGPHCSNVLDAVGGTTYRIAAAGAPQEGEYGTYELDIHALDVPANDEIEDATTLSSDLPTTIGGSTIDATNSIAEPNHNPDYSQTGGSVWYRWTARSDDATIFSACSGTEPNVMAVYSGTTFDDLKRVASANTGCRNGLEGARLAIAPVSGQTYLIAVAALDRDYESDFTLSAIGPPKINPPIVKPPIVRPPKAQFSLKKAIKKCKKIKGQSRKAKKRRASCIKKARKKAAIIKCRKIVNPGKEKKCIRKVQRRFR